MSAAAGAKVRSARRVKSSFARACRAASLGKVGRSASSGCAPEVTISAP